MKAHRYLLGFIGCLWLVSLACSMPSVDLLDRTPATPTPIGDTLTFKMPIYNQGLAAGDVVPGTGLVYNGRSDDGGFQVSIDGQTAVKRNADSFFWSGVVAPGVFANYNLRISAEAFGELQVIGPVELFVLNPNPVAITGLPENSGYLRYQFIPIEYRVPAGLRVPGTAVSFLGIQEQSGTQTAQMSGLTGISNLALGDSLVWTGQLLPNVYVRYSLRVLGMDEFGLHLGGTADVLVQP